MVKKVAIVERVNRVGNVVKVAVVWELPKEFKVLKLSAIYRLNCKL
jgi:hypothetical protein